LDILITNDDGAHAAGMAFLEEELAALGRTVTVAPDREQSVCSHALTLHRPLRLKRIGPNRYTVDGTPSDCVTLAVTRILTAKPALLVSGINRGPNMAHDVTYSGTVAAAMEGTLHAIPSMAVSLCSKEEPLYFRQAARIAAALARRVLSEGVPPGTFLNVNVPNLPPGDIAGCRVTCQGTRLFNAEVEEKTDPRGDRYYWIGRGPQQSEDCPRSDVAAVRAGYVSITPMQLDLTDQRALPVLDRWDWSRVTDAAGGDDAHRRGDVEQAAEDTHEQL